MENPANPCYKDTGITFYVLSVTSSRDEEHVPLASSWFGRRLRVDAAGLTPDVQKF